MENIVNGPLFDYIVLPLLIFFARIIDVSIGTLRIIFVSKGKKKLAPLLGFFEVLVWIIVIGKIMQHLNNFTCYIGYAAGFAAGNFVGMFIEEKLAMGIVGIRIITRRNASMLIEKMKNAGYGVTTIDAKGTVEDVSVIFSTIKRQELNNVIDLINEYNPKAFYTVEDIKFVNEGYFKKITNQISSSKVI